MSNLKLSGKVQTVLSLIAPDELGVTLPHEHLMCDLSCMVIEPDDETGKALMGHPVTMDNLWRLRYNFYHNIDVYLFLDEQEAINEAMHFKSAGGNSIVDVTPYNIGRHPAALARISRTTGLHVIMGSGYYMQISLSPEMDTKTEDEITEEIVRDITVGVGDSDIRAGVIGEIGCSWPLTNNERKSLRAAARAQRITGAPLHVHTGYPEEAPMEMIKIVEKVGGDLTRTVIDHIDRTVRDPNNRIELANTGCYLEYDLFGREGYYPMQRRLIDFPNDTQKINEIIDLIDKGYLNQILVSQDICNKTNRCAYGGWGYAHILRNTLPVMRAKGITEEQIHTLMVDNPRRLFTFI